MTDVKYQVFVSSTFVDLQEERREVMQALLELDCIPAAMELFPASDDESWTLIQRVIDLCDYYVVILGNRYGSVAPDGLSFTEKEYDYARSIGMPVLGFVPKAPDAIAVGKSEMDAEKRQQLDRFRQKVQNKNCKFYDGAEDLGSKVSRSLVQAIRSHPRPGWVRAGKTGDPILAERLRQEIEVLQEQLTAVRERPPVGAETLAQGAAEFAIGYRCTFIDTSSVRKAYQHDFSISWDEIFSNVGPCLMHEATESAMADALKAVVTRHAKMTLKGVPDADYFEDAKLDPTSFDTIKIQLTALGLIQISQAKRKVGDHRTYFCLTPYGTNYLTRLRAVSRA
jgi:siroheme synthase